MSELIISEELKDRIFDASDMLKWMQTDIGKASFLETVVFFRSMTSSLIGADFEDVT